MSQSSYVPIACNVGLGRGQTPDADIEPQLPLNKMPDHPQLTSWAGDAWIGAWKLGECTVIVTKEFGLWHLSISNPDRDPTWNEISQARYRLIPDDHYIVMVLSPRRDYVNVNKHCFQLVEIEKPPRHLR
jgi:hypothetical protein